MKKLLVLLLAFALSAGFVFAQEEVETAPPAPAPMKTEFFNMEISIGFPVHWTSGIHDDTFYPFHPPNSLMEDRTATANTSIGFSMNFNFTSVFGIVLDMDFFYAARLAGFSNPTSDYASLTSANILFGPVFYLFNNNILRIPLAFGVHMFYYGDDIWMPELDSAAPPGSGMWMNRNELQFGLGMYLGIQFHFNKDLYIFSRTNVAIDLMRFHSIKGWDGTDYFERECDDMWDIHWTVKPTIGIGIKY